MSEGDNHPDIAWKIEIAGWTTEMRQHWEERAAIMEFEAGLPWEQAEFQAYISTRQHFLREGLLREPKPKETAG